LQKEKNILDKIKWQEWMKWFIIEIKGLIGNIHDQNGLAILEACMKIDRESLLTLQ